MPTRFTSSSLSLTASSADWSSAGTCITSDKGHQINRLQYVATTIVQKSTTIAQKLKSTLPGFLGWKSAKDMLFWAKNIRLLNTTLRGMWDPLHPSSKKYSGDTICLKRIPIVLRRQWGFSCRLRRTLKRQVCDISLILVSGMSLRMWIYLGFAKSCHTLEASIILNGHDTCKMDIFLNLGRDRGLLCNRINLKRFTGEKIWEDDRCQQSLRLIKSSCTDLYKWRKHENTLCEKSCLARKSDNVPLQASSPGMIGTLMPTPSQSFLNLMKVSTS